MLLNGEARPRPPVHRSQAHGGVEPLSKLTHRTQRFEPLPTPLGEPPYHYDLGSAISGIAEKANAYRKLVFHTVGDTGGIKDAVFQSSVSSAMKEDLNLKAEDAPQFFYHLGDVVYFNGEIPDYYSQFYEPYDHYGAPILGIPGNHDGAPVDANQQSLDGWVRYFMTPRPVVRPESQDAPRATMSLPNPFFTVDCPFATIVGMYTNVPEHGSIDSVQQQWLTNEFATAPRDKALILALHHPVYSFDDHHSGSPRMADAVQHAINDSRRVPNLVLMAHVHNYQRIERTLVHGRRTPFIVAGHGGYYHLHNLNKGIEVGAVDPQTKAKLVAANDKQHGYLIITVTKDKIAGRMTTITEDHHSKGQIKRFDGEASADVFEYDADLIELAPDVIVTL